MGGDPAAVGDVRCAGCGYTWYRRAQQHGRYGYGNGRGAGAAHEEVPDRDVSQQSRAVTQFVIN